MRARFSQGDYARRRRPVIDIFDNAIAIAALFHSSVYRDEGDGVSSLLCSFLLLLLFFLLLFEVIWRGDIKR